MTYLNDHAKRTLLSTFLLIAVLLIPVIGVQAECRLNGVDNGGDVGTFLQDKIVCNGSNQPVGDVEGSFSDDILKIRATVPGDVDGGDGDDDIFVQKANGVVEGLLFGDEQLFIESFGFYGVSGFGFYQGGDDILTIDGTVQQRTAGDWVGVSDVDDTNATIMGGDDTIIVNGKAGPDLGGEFLQTAGENSSFSSFAGNDTIQINGSMMTTVLGELIYSSGSGTTFSNFGGADMIEVTGSAGFVYGDGFQLVGHGNQVSVQVSGADNLILNGLVYYQVYGDQAQISGTENNVLHIVDADDNIQIGETGSVGLRLFGDFLVVGGITNAIDDYVAGDDSIIIHGTAAGEIFGDYLEITGNTITIQEYQGGADTIRVFGTAESEVVGDYVVNNGSGNKIVQYHGGDDTIQIYGRAEYNVYGDAMNIENIAESDSFVGGDDRIIVAAGATVVNDVYGDFIVGEGGDDVVIIAGTVEGNVAGDNNGFFEGGDDVIRVKPGGVVLGEVYGDNVFDSSGGNDVIVIEGSTGSVYGDGGSLVSIDSSVTLFLDGNDSILISETGTVESEVYGEFLLINSSNITVDQYVAGDDSITIHGTVAGEIFGDYLETTGDSITIEEYWGGADTIRVFGTAESDVVGDYVVNSGSDNTIVQYRGGDDTIQIYGRVENNVYGDAMNIEDIAESDSFVGGDDQITIAAGATVVNSVYGDFIAGEGGDDVVIIAGTVEGNVAGDNNGFFEGGDDVIRVKPGGVVLGEVYGDNVFDSNGGNDVIVIEGNVGSVYGDYALEADGGNDTIRVTEGAMVDGDVIGDNVLGQGGDDIIRIRGTVNGNVIGDEAGTPGNDTIRIYATAVVGGSVCADNLSGCTQDPGQVKFLDENTNPNQDGEDTIIIAGKVLGDVIAGANYGAQADDTVVIFEGAEVAGTIYAGDEDSGDTLIYIENIVNEEMTIREVLDSINELNVATGKVTINGATYTLDDIESVAGAVGQIACFGMDYRMNKSSDGCSARSQSEKDAIQWHRDNPGNDGRLPGLESCAVYLYGNALRIYEIIDGSEGELVAEIWGGALSNAPATNELLGKTADGNISLYHLASGELQIECHNLVDGKTQVRVLSDLTGTVTNAYDKG